MEMVANREQAVQALQKIGRTLYERGLVNGAEGNISLRAVDGTVYISARGSRLGELRPEDVAHITTAGQAVEPGPEPTSEYLLHTLVYESCPELRVVLHTHSAYATAVAVNRENVPPLIDEMTILLGGGIDVAPYAPPGTPELARGAAQGLREKADRALQRQRERRQHEKNLREGKKKPWAPPPKPKEEGPVQRGKPRPQKARRRPKDGPQAQRPASAKGGPGGRRLTGTFRKP